MPKSLFIPTETAAFWTTASLISGGNLLNVIDDTCKVQVLGRWVFNFFRSRHDEGGIRRRSSKRSAGKLRGQECTCIHRFHRWKRKSCYGMGSGLNSVRFRNLHRATNTKIQRYLGSFGKLFPANHHVTGRQTRFWKQETEVHQQIDWYVAPVGYTVGSIIPPE